VEDHVHLLLETRATHRLADVMRGIKAGSSAWIHRDVGIAAFGWQDGYGAFTVSPSHRSRVTDYIRNQEARHRVETFQDEYLRFLKESGVTYDERYVWG
jgi:REP element-mobilizing transposase RayT